MNKMRSVARQPLQLALKNCVIAFHFPYINQKRYKTDILDRVHYSLSAETLFCLKRSIYGIDSGWFTLFGFGVSFVNWRAVRELQDAEMSESEDQAAFEAMFLK